MKTLQNNFTTPEQSKRLLKLGVPVDSADCYYDTFDSHDPSYFRLEVRQNPKELSNSLFNDYHRLIPCWSVGRLIEIIRECATDFDVCKNLIETLIIPTTNNVDVLVRLISADEFRSSLDFSKLEE